MLKRRPAFVVLAICLALIADSSGQSQRPSPRSRESVQPPISKTAKPAQPPASDQRGTEQSPVIVKVLPSDDEKQKATAEANREEQKAANDESLAKFTERLFWATVALSFIAALQLFVFCWQGIQLKRTVDFANREFTSTHRPKLVVRELLLFDPSPSRVTTEIQYVIANSGAGRAEIVESHIELIMIMIKDAILRPLQPSEGANPIGSVTLEPGEHIIREAGSTIGFAEFTNEMNRQFYTPAEDFTKLVFRGFIIYADKNRLKRRMAFCREYKFRTRRFRIVDDPDFEYAD